MIPEKMRLMRLVLGLTQLKLAGILDKHVDTIRNYEKGRTPVPFGVYDDLRALYRERKNPENIHGTKKPHLEDAAA